MESSVKTWLLRLLVVVPVICLIISVIVWKHTQNETADVQTAKRELRADFDEKIQKLRSEVENLHTQKREMQSQVEADTVRLQQQLRDGVDNLHMQKREMQSQIEADKLRLQQQLHDEVDNLHMQKREMQSQIKKDNARFKRQLKVVKKTASSANREKRTTPPGGGAVYVHWGRVNCSSTTDLVYTGIAGGGSHVHKGAAVNLLCMTLKPAWGKCPNNVPPHTFIYGTEYEVGSNDFPLGHDRAENLHDHDVPCSVCQSATRTRVIMIPGTTQCVAGWTEEYHGYLMAGYYNHVAATEYTCIDENPDADPSGVANKNGRLLYRVKGKCGSLPCPPYEDMREITCVVCTK